MPACGQRLRLRTERVAEDEGVDLVALGFFTLAGLALVADERAVRLERVARAFVPEAAVPTSVVSSPLPAASASAFSAASRRAASSSSEGTHSFFS